MKFKCKVLKKDQLTQEIIEASSKDAVLEYAKANNMFVVEAKETANASLSFLQSFLNHVSFTDVVNFTRQLAIMLNAGLNLAHGLDILNKQSSNPALGKLISGIVDDVQSGSTLSSSLKKHPNTFTPFYISLVKAGEASGKLDNTLLRLADNLEKRRALIGKIKGALIYPAVLFVGMVAVMVLILTFVVPKMLTIYENFEAKLPASTRFLSALSGILQKFGVFILIGFVIMVILFLRAMRTKRGKQLFDLIFMKLPLINKMVKMTSLVDVLRTFSILIQSGVSILDTINIVGETASNSMYKNAFARVYSKVEKGLSLGKALEYEDVFPPLVVQMAAVGEESGHLDETFMRISVYYEAESEVAIKAVTSLIEPAMLVFLGVGVGFIAIAVITPIYNLAGQIQ